VEEAEEPDEQAQVAAALAQLYNASDVSQRIEGAEQLGAYPTPEAESALAQVLGSDSNADVRSAAAQSLGYVEKPTDTTLNALAGALEDQNEEVRMNALSTLEDFLLGADEGSSIHNKVLTELKSRKASQTVPKETREAIKEILEDQASNAQ
jgi:signal recognition particle GTPase